MRPNRMDNEPATNAAAVERRPWQSMAGSPRKHRRCSLRLRLALLMLAALRVEMMADAIPSFRWIQEIGTDGFDISRQVALDAFGSIYVAGAVEGALPGQGFEGARDAFVRKYDADGVALWTRQFGTEQYEEATGVAVDDSSEVYVVGHSLGALPDQTNAGMDDAFIRKYDANGTERWTRQFGTATDDGLLAVSTDSSGVYVAGWASGPLPGQIAGGGDDAFVRKYDAGGTQIWTRQFGTSESDAAIAIFVDASGLYVAGYTYGVLPDQIAGGDGDVFLRKYDWNGDELWTRQFGTESFEQALAVHGDGFGVYVVGFTYGALPDQSSSGQQDVFVRKYDSSGNELWTRQFGNDGVDMGIGAFTDGSGVYIAGFATGALPNQQGTDEDSFVRKYSPSGTELWTLQFGVPGLDMAFSVAVTPSGVFTAGFSGLGGSGHAYLLKLAGATTIVGSSVPVAPIDTTTGTVPASVTFASVDQAGWTALTTTNAGPPLPTGFSLGQPPIYYDLTTTAEYSGSISVCIDYSWTFFDESSLRLFHFEGGEWIDRTTTVDTGNHTICGVVSSLSPFAIISAPVARIQQPIDLDGFSVFKANRGVVPVKFDLSIGGQPSCELPPATIGLTRTSGGTPGAVNEGDFLTPADAGSTFRVSACHYSYNLRTSSLGVGSYRVDIKIAGIVVGSGTFGLR